jgi:hypothetical protein
MIHDPRKRRLRYEIRNRRPRHGFAGIAMRKIAADRL